MKLGKAWAGSNGGSALKQVSPIQRMSGNLFASEFRELGVPLIGDLCRSLAKNPMPLSYAIILFVILLIPGCSPAPVVGFTNVSITNCSAVTLTNVIVSGTGFSDQVGAIAARSVKQIRVHPKGDSGLRVAFDADGHHIDSGQQAYFDSVSGYRVTVVISADLGVSVSTHLPPEGPNRTVQANAPEISNLKHIEEGGNRFVTFEFRVPPGNRVFVRRSQLVVDSGTARQVCGPPTWAKGTDPSGKFYGPGTKPILCIMEPRERLRRLELETTVFTVGSRAWLWKLKRTWQTKQLSSLKASPPPRPFVSVRSEVISSYQSEPDGAADLNQPVRSDTNHENKKATRKDGKPKDDE